MHTGHFIVQEIQESTFQAVISTDGYISFVIFIYEDPAAVFSYVTSNSRAVIGFDLGNDDIVTSADIGQFLNSNDETLGAVNVYRVDGKYEHYV